ncbi:MAG: hypothetical protein AAF560_31540 [Acidobacteriota bacterium]
MKHQTLTRLAFASLLLAVFAFGATTATAKLAPPPCTWTGDCPVAFCSGSGTYVGTCSEEEPCTDCVRDCKVYVVGGVQCKTNCQYQ